MISLVILDFDGTLCDTRESITQSFKLTFKALLPDYTPPLYEIHRLIASGAGLSDTFSGLHPNLEEFLLNKTEWIEKYQAIYASYGQTLIKPFPGAKELLKQLKALKIPIAIVSHKNVAALRTAVERNGMGDYIPEDLIIGSNTLGATRKPHPSSFTDVLVPILRDNYGVHVEAKNVLMVGDTIADIQYASNIQSKICWCRYGYGDQETCQALVAEDSVADSLEDVLVATQRMLEA